MNRQVCTCALWSLLQVGDFGLSLKMDHMETHVSNVYQGTLTHMAPEIMLDGRVSKAADVYGEARLLRRCMCRCCWWGVAVEVEATSAANAVAGDPSPSLRPTVRLALQIQL